MIEVENIEKDANMITSLSTVLVSRLMFNIREQREHPAVATITTASSSAPTSTMLLHTLTNIEHVDEAAVHELEVPIHQGGSFDDAITCGRDERGRSDFFLQTDIEMVQIADYCEREDQFGAQCR